MSVSITNSVYIDKFNAKITYLMFSMKEGTSLRLLRDFVKRMDALSNYFTITYQRLHEDAHYFYLLVDMRSLNNEVSGHDILIDMIVDAWEAESSSVPFSEEDKFYMSREL